MDLEIPVINFNGTFESMSIFDNGENTFYKFTNVKFGDFSNLDRVRKFKGTYMPISPAPHYFHFLKECLGTYLHYKKNIDKNIKPIFLDLKWDPTEYHNCQKVIQEVFSRLNQNETGFLYIPIVAFEFKDSSPIEFEEIIVGYDAHIFLNLLFPPFDQFKHQNNEEVREFFNDLLIKDPNMPERIYISRRQVSKVLEKNNDLGNISRYNEKYLEDAMEDYFVSKGFKVIELSGMSIQDQIKYFYNAKYVAGILGSGIWNGIFSDNDTTFLVLRTHPWFLHEYNKDIDKVITSEYHLIDLFNKKDYNEMYNSLKKEIELKVNL